MPKMIAVLCRRKPFLGLLALAVLSSRAPLYAAPLDRGPSDRPKIGLVLSGGGARGAAHIGVIRVLEQMHIPIDCIAGTSMGSIVGGLYAAGLGVDEMEKELTSIDWGDVFRDLPPRENRPFRSKLEDKTFLVKAKPGVQDGKVVLPKGAIQGQKLDLILNRLALPAAEIRDFDKLRIPYRAVATDLGTGEPVVLGSGNLARVMRASMSIPSALSPVVIDDKTLVDGGVSDNLPMDVARALCGEVLIVVAIGTPLEPADKLKTVLDITSQLSTIMTQQNTQRQLRTLKPGDVLIEPDLGDITTMDFPRAAEAAAIGAQATRARHQALEHLALSDTQYRAYLARPAPAKESQVPVIDFVRIENTSNLSDEVIRARLHLTPGQRLDVPALERDLGDIYGLGDFERVDYQLVEDKGRTGIVVKAIAKSWGPNYLQFGLNLQSDFKGDSAFNIGAAFIATDINSLGGEVRAQAQVGNDFLALVDYYQPLDPGYRYFLDPGAAYQAFNFGVVSDGDTVAQVRVHGAQLGLAGGRNLGDWGELRVGLRWASGKTSLRIGEPGLPLGDFTDAGYFVRLSADTLDNVNFPRRGVSGQIEYFDSLEVLGADSAFQTISVGGGRAQSWGRHTLIASLELGGKLAGTLPAQDLFFRGGFLDLSGFSRRALSGQYTALGRLIYLQRANSASPLLDLPLYVGASLEAGNVWEDSSDISLDSLLTAGSLFVGLDTPIAPLYVGAGYAQGGEKSLYLFLGRTF